MADQRPHPTIVMTPPTQLGAASSSNPRRIPAHRSVSLLHSPRAQKPTPTRDQSDSSSDDSNKPKPLGSNVYSDSPSSLQPLGRDSSGESSNAEKWFEKSNNEVRDNSASFADNDPPFFMRNSSSSETPPEAQQQMRDLLGIHDRSNSLPLRTGLLHLGTDGSSTEDFRSVIDDLTIENKKLKRRLKKYEKLQDSHLRDEKLFEVRIHGLPPEKKRELEDTLRKFASSLGPSGFPTNGYGGLLPALNTHKTASSQTSLQNTDSAYASMSASGQGSTAQSGGESKYQQNGVNTASRRQNIHSYLHHIPEGLLPQTNPANMTERAKKKLVVRRLEQIFAGKGAGIGGHQHPLQQQEVSQMAARADRAAVEAQGHPTGREGTREAHIMSQKAGDAAEAAESRKQDDTNTSPDENENSSNSQQDKVVPTNPRTAQVSKGTGEQRPTRPLDLDPDRAQVPADNIRYMRHLGFSPPEPGTLNSLEEDHGWVYLNLLINMAQLHTINVTSEFVKKALTEMSSKFELSIDGRKVRWKGGRSVTRTSSSGGASSNERTDVNTPDQRISPRKRPKLVHRDSGKSGATQGGASKSRRGHVENNKLTYTPLFFHKDSSDGMDDSSEEEDDSESSPYPAPVAGDSSGMTSSGIRTASSKRQKKQDDGPIIFYNNARFCTDLSGDRKAIGNTNPPPYTPATSFPVGKPQEAAATRPYEKRGPLASAADLPEPMDLSDNPIPESMELSFPPQSPLKAHRKDDLKLMEMEVTGIGGVWPADNFAIAVESRHARLDQSSAPSVQHESSNKRIPARFASIFRESGPNHRTRSAMHKQQQQIVATRVKQMAPSQLPPAIGLPWSDESMGDDESDVDDDMSVSPESPHAFPPSAAPQPVELHYTSSDEEEDDDDDDDESDDGSLDLLAAARQADPEAVREQEREYDANMAERLAEEIPAGSSAATAGGGSGFASPANGMNREEYQRAVQEARARPLKRSKTADSLKVQLPAQSSSDEDEEMEE